VAESRYQPRARSSETTGSGTLIQAVVAAFQAPDLRMRILFTFGMLVIFRFVAHVPIPNVDQYALQNLFRQEGTGEVLGLMNIFSGGALENMSIAALGVYPYITASIVMQILTPFTPSLKALSQEGEMGRQRINQYTHWLTVPIAALQSYGQLVILSQAGVVPAVSFAPERIVGTLAVIVSMIAGTMFLVWLGELITEKGIGNGLSIIIFGGIVIGLPSLLQGVTAEQGRPINLLFFFALWLAVIYIIVIFSEAVRRIPVQYGRSVFRGGQMRRASGTTYLPIRVNSAGMIPLIFAFSIVTLPGIAAAYFADPLSDAFVARSANFLVGLFNGSSFVYWVILFILVVMFAFFYTFVVFQQQQLHENLQKNGGFIPGIRPGRPTQEYLNRIVLRITWGGALFLGFVAVSPYIIGLISDVQTFAQSPVLTGTAILIMVGVALDTMRQLEAQLLTRRYEGFMNR